MKMFKKKCYNGGTRHKFEARYSEKPHDQIKYVKGSSPGELRSFMFFNVYEKDICVWCGKEIKKGNYDYI